MQLCFRESMWLSTVAFATLCRVKPQAKSMRTGGRVPFGAPCGSPFDSTNITPAYAGARHPIGGIFG